MCDPHQILMCILGGGGWFKCWYEEITLKKKGNVNEVAMMTIKAVKGLKF